MKTEIRSNRLGDEIQPPIFDTAASAKENIDENGVPRELWEHRDEMKRWIDSMLGDLLFFLANPYVKYKIVCGTMNAHFPDKDQIILSVEDYKEWRESKTVSAAMMMFRAFHEFGHLRRMFELDWAGKENMRMHFNYEGKKVIGDKEKPERYALLSPTYRKFYNILEDAIDNNSLVFTTQRFNEISPIESVRNVEEVRDWYTTEGFALYYQVGAGNGSYEARQELDKKTKRSVTNYVFVGKGNGNIEVRKEQDYQDGFDWNTSCQDLGRSGQFLTFFMKNQMIHLDERDVFDMETNPDGKHILSEDVAMIFSRPLSEVYEVLLTKALNRYQNDPSAWTRYSRFMSASIMIPVFRDVNGRAEQVGADNEDNVFHEDCFDDNGKVNIDFAVLKYIEKIKQVAGGMGFDEPEEQTFLNIFNQLKKKKYRSNEFASPLVYNQLEATRVIRRLLEPIFSLLCILDDNFEITLPPEGPPGQPPGPIIETIHNPEKPVWEVGETVVNVKDGHPRNGDRGIIRKVLGDATGKIIYVEIEYFEKKENNTGNTMSSAVDIGSSNEEFVVSGEFGEFFDPDNELALFVKEGEGEGEEERPPDERKKIIEENKDKKPTKEKPRGAGKADKNHREGVDLDEAKVAQDLLNVLDALVRKDQRAADKKEADRQRQTPQYQDKVLDRLKAEDLAARIPEAEAMGTSLDEEPEQGTLIPIEQVAQDIVALENELRPFANEMAREWLRIVENIVEEIEVVRMKFFRGGRINMKKFQEFLILAQAGEDVNTKLMYERLVEHIMTEIKPRMLRVCLLIDNSGSMSEVDKLKQLRLATLLLNTSLQSLSHILKERMEQMLGANYKESMDLICDIELRLFASAHRIIKYFDVKDFSFLNDKDISPPKLSADNITLTTALAFRRMNGGGGGTSDAEAWQSIRRSHLKPELLKAIESGLLTEVILQLSDGDIDSNDIPVARNVIEKLSEKKIIVGGFSIGENAYEYLAKRHSRDGETFVVRADDIGTIARKFGEFLVKSVEQSVRDPMIKALHEAVGE